MQVALQGHGVDHAAITALLEVLHGYAACRGLAFLGCTFGDDSLQTVSRLLQNGCGKWSTGPRLQFLEISLQQSDPLANGELTKMCNACTMHSSCDQVS